MKKEKQIAANRKAKYEYELIEDYVAGISLVGTEVKSIRRGKVSINESYCCFDNGELYVKGMHVTEHDVGDNHDPTRDRKLLLTKKQLKSLEKKVIVKGLTIIPISIFLNANGYVKIKIALAKGKQTHDKKMAIKERDIDRDTKSETQNKIR